MTSVAGLLTNTVANAGFDAPYPDGITMGVDSNDLISFFGATAVAQPALTSFAAVATTAVTTAAGIYGFTTAAQAANLVALVNAIRADLVLLGLAAT